MSEYNNPTTPPVTIQVSPEIQEKARGLLGKTVDKARRAKNFVVNNPEDAALMAGLVAITVVGFKLGRSNKKLLADHENCFSAPPEMLEELALYPDLMTIFSTDQGKFKLQYIVPDAG